MPVSQNGWETINGSSLDRSPIPGTGVVPVPGLRPGEVATILLEVGRLFNATVAPVYNPGCWGYAAPAPIPGSNVISNHGSGTAIDLNAPSFPWKVRKMTDAQRNACRAIVARMDGVVAWGGDYTTYVDEMHFEIIGSPDEVRNIAERIKGEDMLNNKNEVDRVFLAALHRRTESEADASKWYGLDTLTALDRIRASKEWLEQNHTLLVAHAATLEEIQRLKASGKSVPVDKSAVLDYLSNNLK